MLGPYWDKFIQWIFYDIERKRWYYPDEIFWVVVGVWVVEWWVLIEYLFAEWWRAYFFLPIRVPTVLVLCMIYWMLTWGFSVWRRTQFGRFTRGERRLWAKALAAFWVAELVTIGSLLIVYCWMNWGPLPLVPRQLLLVRRGLLFEFIIYSYLVFLGYMCKMGTSWWGWRYQLICCFLVMFFFSFLLWRDAQYLLFRDPMDSSHGSRWRNIRATAVVYSLNHEWWVNHTLGRRGSINHYMSLQWVYANKIHPFDDSDILTEYEQRFWLSPVWRWKRQTRNNWFTFEPLWRYYENFDLLNRGYYYPRRIGFIPKRICMWQFLTFLKMFHHLIILLWWTLFTYRCFGRKRAAFSFAGSCQFNVYMCLILALMVYFIYYALYWEQILKIRPGVFTIHRFSLLILSCYYQLLNGLLRGKRQCHLRSIWLARYWWAGAIFEVALISKVI